jgi:hypothetical protein
MSFIGETSRGKVLAPGYFLAHEECVRKTAEIPASMGVTEGTTKHVPMGTLFTQTVGEGNNATTDYIGFVYEDVDVTTGNMPCSVVTKGVVYENRLPAELEQAAKTALEAKGFTFVSEGTVTRPY